MVRNFSSREAKDLIAKHQALLKSLNDIISLESSLKLNIKVSADNLIMQEVLKVLQGISTDELKKYKKGLRTKPLVDNFYNSIADIYSLSINDISNIKGISRDNACAISLIVDEIVCKTRKETKIDLNSDNKSKECTHLVKDISIYKNALPYIENAYSILIDEYNEKIEYLLQDLKISTNLFKWLFASKENKNKSIEAYKILNELLTNDYYNQIQKIISQVYRIMKTDESTAWEDFSKDNSAFYNILKVNTKEICCVNNKSMNIKTEKSSVCSADYYDKLMEKSYSQIVECLLDKYGRAIGDYFVNETCRSKNKKISRTGEGLFCHHIDEDKAILLSNDKYATSNPFEYQKADRLVYCNFLEHLLLHIKIAIEPKNVDANKNEIQGIGGAVNYIVRQLNGFYGGEIPTVKYLANAMRVVENEYPTYIKMLQYLWNTIKSTPLYFQRISKEQLAMNWEGKIIQKIYDRLD